MQIVCLDCGAPMSLTALTDQLIVHCDFCPAKFVQGDDLALTHIDEMPDSEYLGG